LVSNAVVPEIGASERTIWLGGVTDEATCGMGIQSQDENERKVMRIPKRFERLLTNGCVRSGIHQEHAQQHHMSCDSTSLSIMNFESRHRASTDGLHILYQPHVNVTYKEIDIVRGGMEDCKKE
jgi:hypothetical protein